MKVRLSFSTLLGLATMLLGPALARAGTARADFNGDGFEDLAIGVPGQSVNGVPGAGTVNVLYGSYPAGLTAINNQHWFQDSPGVAGTASFAAHFGISVAAGYFNDDAFADLAIGAWEEDVAGVEAAGSVTVLYGSASGLTAAGSQHFTQDTPDILGVPTPYGKFGASLTSGDFDGNGQDDLAISVPGYNDWAGAVNVLYGSADGLTATDSDYWSQDSPDVPETSESGDHFGAALAAHDFDGDRRDDLAIGVPSESFNGREYAGAVIVLHGSPGGLTATGSEIWTQDSIGVPGTAAGGDGFGAALAAGDFEEDGWADLAIGVPGDTVNGVTRAGAVNVLHGTDLGLTGAGSELWSRDSAGIAGTAGPWGGFGDVLAAADFDGDRRADLAVGAPDADVSGIDEAGAVHVIHGSGSGLTSSGSDLWTQERAGIAGEAETYDHFGKVLATGDFDGDGRTDLAIGVPHEEVNGLNYVGAVHVLFGSPSGPTATDSQFWSQASTGVLGIPSESNAFGHALAGR